MYSFPLSTLPLLSLYLYVCVSHGLSLTPAEPATSSSVGGTGVLRRTFGAGLRVARIFFIVFEILLVSDLCVPATGGCPRPCRFVHTPTTDVSRPTAGGGSGGRMTRH